MLSVPLVVRTSHFGREDCEGYSGRDFSMLIS